MDSVKYIGNAADANSGIYHINEVNAGIKDGSWPTNYKIENSLRFNGDSRLTKSQSNSSSSWTISLWAKLTTLSGIQYLFATGTASPNNWTSISWSNSFSYILNNGTGSSGVASTALYRDPSAWYHIVVNKGVTANMWINGVLIGTESNPDAGNVNTTDPMEIGSLNNAEKFNGYLANIQFIDGQALDPSYFATTHPVTGRWVPKPYRGTYGTNGFHLDFSNKNSGTGVGTIGEDKSGNGNHWTSNNLDHSDVVLDSPTNNFAVLNQLNNISHSYSEGNLSCISTVNNALAYANMPIPQIGKWYCEFLYFQTGGTYSHIGVQPDLYNGGYGDRFRIIARSDGSGWINGSSGQTGTFSLASWTTGDIISMICDADTGTLTYYKNGIFSATVSFSDWNNIDNKNRSFFCLASLNVTHKINFGQDPTFSGAKVPSKVYMDSNNQGRFFYQPHEGALALCEANLNQPEITPKQYPIDETNQHRLTYNGNVTQSKFTPYATDGYSLDGMSTGINIGVPSNLISGTGDWSFESWVYLEKHQNYNSLFSIRSANDYTGGDCTIDSNGTIAVVLDYNGLSPWDFIQTSSNTVPLNKWVHICIERYSGDCNVYIDGVKETIGSFGANSLFASLFKIGRTEAPGNQNFKGHMSDIRIKTGGSFYNGTVTVPNAPLSSTDSSLHISSNSKQIIDSSTNSYSLTLTASPLISDWSPYTPELVRKGVHFRRPEDYGGGSFYFDGRTGTTYLNTGYTLDFNTSFTIQGWFFCNGVGNNANWVNIFSNNRGDASGIRLDYNPNTSSLEFGFGNGGTWVNSSGLVGTAKKLEWNYFMITWDGTTYKMFLNENSTPITWAESVGSTTTQELYLGRMRDADTRYYWGYISDFRILRGTALDYEYPTAKLSTVTNTKLLLQPWQTATTRGVFTTPDTYKEDETGKALTYVGTTNITQSSPYKNINIGSIESSTNNNSYISLVNNTDFNFGTGPFTMETWIKRSGDTSSTRMIFNRSDRSGNNMNNNEYAWFITGTEMQVHYPGVIAISGGSDLSNVNNTDWMHVVWERVDTNAGGVHFYVNGVKTSSHQYSFNLDSTRNFEIGGASTSGRGVGFYSDIRIVKGQALYGGTNFIPPAYPLSSTHYTTNGQDPSDSNSTRTAITGTVSLLVQPGTGFTKNSAAQNSKKYFNTLLYTGNGGTQSITGLDFKPDLVWIKSRNFATSHGLFDSVRGVFNGLASDEPLAEVSTGKLSSFNTNGFSLIGGGNENTSSKTYVAWCWKAGGNSNTFNINGAGYGTYNQLQTANTSLPASSTSGMIVPSGMSINTDAGFSIVKYIGTGSTGGIVPHGLNKKPHMVIIKNLDDGARSWNITSFITTPSTVLTANTFNIGSKTGGVLGLNYSNGGGAYTIDGQTSGSGQNHIAYCWHSVPGYSAFGSYEGNQNPNGPFVYTGFRPAFVLTKTIDFTENWTISDSARSPNNQVDLFLRPDETAGDTSSAATMDFLSNGFKLRTGDTKTNVSSTIIYMAFAEQPFTKTTAR